MPFVKSQRSKFHNQVFQKTLSEWSNKKRKRWRSFLRSQLADTFWVHTFCTIKESLKIANRKKGLCYWTYSDLEEKLHTKSVTLLWMCFVVSHSKLFHIFCQSVQFVLLTCPSPPPLMIFLQSLVPAMAVTPVLCALWMMSMSRPLSGANTRILPSFHATRQWNIQRYL